VVELERKIKLLEERIIALERENKILREDNESLRQGTFGRKSERLQPGQLALYLGEAAADSSAQPAPTIEVPAHERTKSGHGRSEFPPSLPRNVIVLDVPEHERFCTHCSKAMCLIGVDVSERGQMIPAQIVVNRYERRKYGCPDGHCVMTANAPEGVIEGAKYEASVYAWLATAKYSDHLPLNRLEGILKRQGVHLPKQTMWDMLVRLDELVAQPVLRQMRIELQEEPVLHADETPITLRLEDGKGSRTGYAFGWRNLRESEESKVLVEFKTSRSRDGPSSFLGKWKGTLIVDGYGGYDEVVANNGITRAGCWSHARRKLKEALDCGARAAAGVLVHVQRLFRLERAVLGRAQRDGLGREEIRELRSRVRVERSTRVVEKIYAVANGLATQHATLPKSKLGKALSYLDRQRDTLKVFLSDPRLPIHNNDTERDLRHLAVGRNNWLVFASERGGEVGCRLYSLVLSCREAGVDPQRYLEDVLTRVSTTKAREIASLTPWAWARARRDSDPHAR
jgi:transposase